MRTKNIGCVDETSRSGVHVPSRNEKLVALFDNQHGCVLSCVLAMGESVVECPWICLIQCIHLCHHDRGLMSEVLSH